jgi:hypothetical protein
VNEMAKVICKGTILKQDISSTLTAVAQVSSISMSGAASETVESRTLDGGAAIEHIATGYYEPGGCSFELEYDPALAGHSAITDTVHTPAETDWQITYADAGTTTHDFTAGGAGFDITIDPANLLKATVNLKLSGANVFT